MIRGVGLYSHLDHLNQETVVVGRVTASIHSEYLPEGFTAILNCLIFNFTNFRNIVFCDKSKYLAVFRLKYLLTVLENHAFARYLISRIENPFEKLAVSSSFQLCLSLEGGLLRQHVLFPPSFTLQPSTSKVCKSKNCTFLPEISRKTTGYWREHHCQANTLNDNQFHLCDICRRKKCISFKLQRVWAHR